MPSYDTALDMAYTTADFILASLALPLQMAFPNLPGINANSPSTLGAFFGGSSHSGENVARLSSLRIWFWVMIIALVAVYM